MAEQSVTVLLIEDNSVEQKAIARLIDLEFNVHVAESGRQGIELLHAIHPDCVLLDSHLSDMGALDILTHCAEGSVPVILLALEDDAETVDNWAQQGVQGYLPKQHLSQAVLMHAIASALRWRELQRALAGQQMMLIEQNRQVRDLASALTLAEQSERERISQVLHDHVQQLLYGIQMRVHLTGLDLPSEARTHVDEHLTEIEALLSDAINMTRSLSVELNPPALKDKKMGPAMKWLASYMLNVHGLAVDCHIQTEYQLPTEDLRVLLFQLARELLFNVVKHSNVEQAKLTLYEDAQNLYVRVEDDGVGFDASQLDAHWNPQQGFGLFGVRERLALFGGDLGIDSHPGNGARVTITLPKTSDSAPPATAPHGR